MVIFLGNLRVELTKSRVSATTLPWDGARMTRESKLSIRKLKNMLIVPFKKAEEEMRDSWQIKTLSLEIQEASSHTTRTKSKKAEEEVKVISRLWPDHRKDLTAANLELRCWSRMQRKTVRRIRSSESLRSNQYLSHLRKSLRRWRHAGSQRKPFKHRPSFTVWICLKRKKLKMKKSWRKSFQIQCTWWEERKLTTIDSKIFSIRSKIKKIRQSPPKNQARWTTWLCSSSVRTATGRPSSMSSCCSHQFTVLSVRLTTLPLGPQMLSTSRWHRKLSLWSNL